MYSYKKIAQKDQKAVFNLLKTCFNLNQDTYQKQLYWRYISSNFYDQMIAYGAYDDQKNLVSFYANVPYKIAHNDKLISVYLCLDMATHPDHRRQGLISKLSKYVYKEIDLKTPLVSIGFSNQKGIQVDKYATDYGYSIIGKFQTYIAPVLKSNNNLYTFKETKAPSFNLKDKHFYSVYKDSTYLRWRYQNKSFKKYRYFSIFESEKIIACLIIKSSKHKIQLLDILEYDDFSYTKLLDTFKEITNKNNKPVASISILDNQFWKETLSRVHFKKQPFKKSPYFLTIRPNKKYQKNTQLKKLSNPDNWYLISGDIL